MRAPEKLANNGEAPQRRRQSLRLKEFNYSNAGASFITIVAQNRSCLFGEIIDGQMRLNEAGDAVARWWFELTRKFSASKRTNLLSCRIIATASS